MVAHFSAATSSPPLFLYKAVESTTLSDTNSPPPPLWFVFRGSLRSGVSSFLRVLSEWTVLTAFVALSHGKRCGALRAPIRTSISLLNSTHLTKSDERQFRAGSVWVPHLPLVWTTLLQHLAGGSSRQRTKLRRSFQTFELLSTTTSPTPQFCTRREVPLHLPLSCAFSNGCANADGHAERGYRPGLVSTPLLATTSHL